MTDSSFAAQADAWRAELERTAKTCATFYARRVPHWIATGSQIWGAQMESTPLLGQSLPDELMRTARREIELRGEFTRRIIGEFAEVSSSVPATQVLVDCTTMAAELIRRGCRDVAKDIEHASHFLHGIDGGCAERAMSEALTTVTDEVLEVVKRRPDFTS